ncbi:glycosyltransferase family 4 protein [Microlunatus panaciterrae]|uniref:Glycosyltransferase involved in cell wall biosynthesis n=1 Tax=Microlunatus panaciterrae TaxID=400768 RepID=A0ABS2RHP0_9ACTN|nr:glycosyltransferase family 4 protein [Microlunatus panaciterrae]MBM7798524.1 glycosyltransferase involved in cell wall biosynthesis [Microlunatus panaciterrae]
MTGKPSTTVLIANPAADVYGSDLQMLASVSALRAEGWRVVVAVPADGQLVPRLRDLGAEIEFVDFPVLRRASANPTGLAKLAAAVTRALPRMRRLIKRVDPALVYVNTTTLPWWLLASRSMRVPAICHVHEAEDKDSRMVRKVITWPLRLASAVVANGRSAFDTMVAVEPRLSGKAQIVYNGVPAASHEPEEPARRDPARIVVVGRLSPRKGVHVALEAVSTLRAQGRDVEIELCGSAFEGYEWYVDQLRARARDPHLAGAVTFSGYCSPIWPALARADLVVAPSFGESLGNAVVEAQYALRPVVATSVQGHLETVTHEQTGLLVPVDDVDALAAAIARLLDDKELAGRLAAEALRQARRRFSTERYDQEITGLVRRVADSRRALAH